MRGGGLFFSQPEHLAVIELTMNFFTYKGIQVLHVRTSVQQILNHQG